MVTATVVIAIAVLLFLARHFMFDLLCGLFGPDTVSPVIAKMEAELEEALRPATLLKQQRRQARTAFPSDMLEFARGVAYLLDPVEDGLHGEARTLYRQAKEEIRSAWIDFRVPGPWAVQTVRTYQRRHHARQTRRTGQLLKTS